MSNTIRDSYGREIAWRCLQCGTFVESMWGNTCNACRRQNQQHEELMAKYDKLTKAIEAMTPSGDNQLKERE